MRTRSQSRNLADLPVGSATRVGFEGKVTRASQSRSRRLANPLLPCSESEAFNPLLPCSGSEAFNQLLRPCCGGEFGRPGKQAKAEWSEWANLPTELIQDIAALLLSADVSEYLRIRSVCKPWRQCTDDPRSCGARLDPRFRPRDWIALSHCASPSRRHLVNISTGAQADVDCPELCSHHCFGIADGLLVLCDKATRNVRLLNPLTNGLAHFPAITDVRDTGRKASPGLKALFQNSEPRTGEDTTIVVTTRKVHVPDPSAINGAGIDDSTSPPTLVLALRHRLWRIVCAKPGDLHWVSVHFGDQRVPMYNYNGQIDFHTLLSFRGRCYVSTHRGDVMVVDLRGPRMVNLSKETALGSNTTAYSYLVRSPDRRMLMVRFLARVNLEEDHYEPSELFTSPEGARSRMEVFEVDVAGRRLTPLSGLGNFTAFVGMTYTVMVTSNKFPKLSANAVYLNHHLQHWRRLGCYHFEDKTITPPRGLRPNAHGRFFLCACHWELADYLICDVDRRW